MWKLTVVFPLWLWSQPAIKLFDRRIISVRYKIEVRTFGWMFYKSRHFVIFEKKHSFKNSNHLENFIFSFTNFTIVISTFSLLKFFFQMDIPVYWMKDDCEADCVTELIKNGMDLTQREPLKNGTFLHYWAGGHNLSNIGMDNNSYHQED